MSCQLSNMLTFATIHFDIILCHTLFSPSTYDYIYPCVHTVYTVPLVSHPCVHTVYTVPLVSHPCVHTVYTVYTCFVVPCTVPIRNRIPENCRTYMSCTMHVLFVLHLYKYKYKYTHACENYWNVNTLSYEFYSHIILHILHILHIMHLNNDNLAILLTRIQLYLHEY